MLIILLGVVFILLLIVLMGYILFRKFNRDIRFYEVACLLALWVIMLYTMDFISR